MGSLPVEGPAEPEPPSPLPLQDRIKQLHFNGRLRLLLQGRFFSAGRIHAFCRRFKQPLRGDRQFAVHCLIKICFLTLLSSANMHYHTQYAVYVLSYSLQALWLTDQRKLQSWTKAHSYTAARSTAEQLCRLRVASCQRPAQCTTQKQNQSACLTLPPWWSLTMTHLLVLHAHTCIAVMLKIHNRMTCCQYCVMCGSYRCSRSKTDSLCPLSVLETVRSRSDFLVAESCPLSASEGFLSKRDSRLLMSVPALCLSACADVLSGGL